MIKVLFIAGAPRSGKDTLARLLTDYYNHIYAVDSIYAVSMVISDPLKIATHYAFDVPDKDINAYEKVKDLPSPHFFGLTPRQAYIQHAEEYMRKLHGRDVYTNILVKRIRNAEANGVKLVIVPGIGFQEEINQLVGEFGTKDTLLISLDRDGTDYSKDSRYPVKHTYSYQHWYLSNNSDKQKLQEDAVLIVDKFLI